MTRKKMEALLHRIWFHHKNLQKALNAAHNADLIKYDNYEDESPCKSLWEVRERVQATTMKQISNTIHSEIRESLYD